MNMVSFRELSQFVLFSLQGSAGVGEPGGHGEGEDKEGEGNEAV